MLADAKEFSSWFGVELDGEFEEGKEITGSFGEFDETEMEKLQKKLGLKPSKIKTPPKHTVFCVVERMQPETYFSFRWIPYGIEADIDPLGEPKTLVEFKLEEVSEGTRVTITESGFDAVPGDRRHRAFIMNDNGWAAQAQAMQAYIEQR